MKPRAEKELWPPRLGGDPAGDTQPTFVSFEGRDNRTGVLLKLQQGDLSRTITNKSILSVKIVSVEQRSRRHNTVHLED